MRRRLLIRLGLVLLFGVVAVIVWRWRETSTRRALAALATAQSETELAQARQRQRALAQHALSPEELEKQRAEHHMLAQVRSEMAALQEKQRKEPPAKPDAATPPGAEPTLTDAILAPKDWRRKGLATPAAATETLLWAAANHETEVLANIFELDARARAEAEKIIAGLPADQREPYGTPERWLAALTEQDMPQGGAGVTNRPDANATDYTSSRLAMQNAAGEKRTITLIWHRQGDEWRLLVQRQIVENYAAKLQGLPLPNPQSPWKP